MLFKHPKTINPCAAKYVLMMSKLLFSNGVINIFTDKDKSLTINNKLPKNTVHHDNLDTAYHLLIAMILMRKMTNAYK
jgi:hypothetical protein